MNFDDVKDAVDAGERANRIVDHNVHLMAQLIAGRLRASGSLDYNTVRAFKKLKLELEDFDRRRGTWRER